MVPPVWGHRLSQLSPQLLNPGLECQSPAGSTPSSPSLLAAPLPPSPSSLPQLHLRNKQGGIQNCPHCPLSILGLTETCCSPGCPKPVPSPSSPEPGRAQLVLSETGMGTEEEITKMMVEESLFQVLDGGQEWSKSWECILTQPLVIHLLLCKTLVCNAAVMTAALEIRGNSQPWKHHGGAWIMSQNPWCFLGLFRSSRNPNLSTALQEGQEEAQPRGPGPGFHHLVERGIKGAY